LEGKKDRLVFQCRGLWLTLFKVVYSSQSIPWLLGTAPFILPHYQLTKPAIGRMCLMAMGIPGFTTPLLQAQGAGPMVILAKKVVVGTVL
jgi:hypothetical protein